MNLSGLINRIKYPDERPIKDVPKPVLAGLVLILLVQVLYSQAGIKQGTSIFNLQSPPAIQLVELSGFSDRITPAKLIMLWLQSVDYQPSISIPFKQLDYKRVVQWLQMVLDLDPRGQYPLFAASRIYADVDDAPRQRLMLDFVYRNFLKDPNHRWPSMAQAVFVAKHWLRDLPLAYRYADAMASHVTVNNVPFWVKQMHIYVLEDMGELESARILIGGLLASGSIKDKHEIRFLEQRMKRLEHQEQLKQAKPPAPGH